MRHAKRGDATEALDVALWLLGIAAVIGSGLAIQFLRGPAAARPNWLAPLVHGAFGAGGLAVLFVALSHGPPPSAMGTAGFGMAAALLLSLALALGLFVGYATFRRRRPAGLLVAVHASLAVAGFVALWTLVSLC